MTMAIKGFPLLSSLSLSPPPGLFLSSSPGCPFRTWMTAMTSQCLAMVGSCHSQISSEDCIVWTSKNYPPTGSFAEYRTTSFFYFWKVNLIFHDRIEQFYHRCDVWESLPRRTGVFIWCRRQCHTKQTLQNCIVFWKNITHKRKSLPSFSLFNFLLVHFLPDGKNFGTKLQKWFGAVAAVLSVRKWRRSSDVLSTWRCVCALLILLTCHDHSCHNKRRNVILLYFFFLQRNMIYSWYINKWNILEHIKWFHGTMLRNN